MRKATRNVTRLLAAAVCGLGSGRAFADTYFSDNFEAQPLNAVGTKIQDPPIGQPYFYPSDARIPAINIVTAPKPVIETKSLELYRDASFAADVAASSVDGV